MEIVVVIPSIARKSRMRTNFRLTWGIQTMGYKYIQKFIIIILLTSYFCFQVFAKEIIIEEGIIRSTNEVIYDSELILKVSVSKIEAHSCGKFDNYTVRIISVLKGSNNSSDSEVCGYAGLTTYGSYILGLNFNKKLNKFVFMPDAIYLESMPNEYYRMISYEDHEYMIGEKKVIVAGFEDKDFISAILKK